MKRVVLILASILFSVPAMNIFGFSSYTVLLLFLMLTSGIKNLRMKRNMIRFNTPFIFLILYTVFLSIFYVLSNNFEENRLIITKNIELFNEILLVFIVLESSRPSENPISNIKLFIQVYFCANILYLVGKAMYPELYFFFHYVDQSYALNSFSQREALLGHEPSYTGPLTMLFFLIYARISKFGVSYLLFLFIVIYELVYGIPKTALAMIVVYLLIRFHYVLKEKLGINKYLVKIAMTIGVLLLSISAFNYLDGRLGLSRFKSLSKGDQYEAISWITRSELIETGLKLVSIKPLGYGYGNSIAVVSRYVDNHINEFESFEIVHANWSARTPKSQIIEYVLGGGLIFLVLFYRYQFRGIHLLARAGIEKRENIEFLSIFWLLLTAIAIGERIPYILISSFLYELLRFRGDKIA
jgi:hypothetical protein